MWHRNIVVVGAFVLAMLPAAGSSMTVAVGPGASIQAAIDAAGTGDVISVSAGEFDEDIDFHGKAITLTGVGPESIIHGTGQGSVVTFANGETAESVLDSFTITGGVADSGGGIFISASSPTIVRNVIVANQARLQGSGVYIEQSNAQLYNNLIVYNRNAGGDPHSVQIQDAAPRIVNNTIARGDSNGIILRGHSPALIMNNVIALNGSTGSGLRGRGICDFSGGAAVIHYNVFYRNVVAALLTDGQDFARVSTAQSSIGLPRLQGNVDGPPRFQHSIPKMSATARPEFFTLLLRARRGIALHHGNPDSTFNNLDGTRNNIGFTGGPYARPQ